MRQTGLCLQGSDMSQPNPKPAPDMAEVPAAVSPQLWRAQQALQQVRTCLLPSNSWYWGASHTPQL